MKVNIAWEECLVIVAIDGRVILDAHWKAAIAVAKPIRSVAMATLLRSGGDAAAPAETAENDDCRCWREGAKVLVDLLDGTILSLAPENAQAFGDELRRAAQKAEEWEAAERIALDSAILMRAGMPFTLSDNPAIQRAAAKEAVGNRLIRRYMPGGVKAPVVFGVPQIVQGPAPGQAKN